MWTRKRRKPITFWLSGRRLAQLAAKDYEQVILNICFPETDVMALLKTLRGLKPMPILLSSTSAALADKVLAYQTRADDYMTKPFETEECLIHPFAPFL